MFIIIVGAGEVGSALAGKLSREGHEVTVVEMREERIEMLKERFDVQGVAGSGTEPKVLLEAGIGRAEVCIAVTNTDAVNVVICMLAKAYGPADIKKMARLRSDSLLNELDHGLAEHFPVDWVVNPELLSMRRIADKVRYPQIDAIVRFVSGKVAVASLTLKAHYPTIGRTIEHLRRERQLPFLVAIIVKNGVPAIPRGDTVLEEGDRIYVIAAVQRLGMILKAVTGEGSTYREVMIAGGTVLAEKIAQKLSDEGIRVKVLIAGRKEAQSQAERNAKLIVLESEATDLATMTEEAGEGMDLFISATEYDEMNVVSSMLAAQVGIKTSVTVIRKRRLAQRLKGISLGMVLSPRSVAVEHILHILKDRHIYEMAEFSPLEGAKVREFVINPTSPMVGKKIFEITFPTETLIGALVRGRRVTIPEGKTILNAGDRVLCFALDSSLEALEGLWEQPGLPVHRR